MTSEHAKQMRELRAEKTKLEAERDHWMNEAIDLRRDLESLKKSETDLVNQVERLLESLITIRDKRKQCNRAVDCQAVAREAIEAHESTK